jgi:hypothetical protein
MNDQAKTSHPWLSSYFEIGATNFENSFRISRNKKGTNENRGKEKQEESKKEEKKQKVRREEIEKAEENK